MNGFSGRVIKHAAWAYVTKSRLPKDKAPIWLHWYDLLVWVFLSEKQTISAVNQFWHELVLHVEIPRWFWLGKKTMKWNCRTYVLFYYVLDQSCALSLDYPRLICSPLIVGAGLFFFIFIFFALAHFLCTTVMMLDAYQLCEGFIPAARVGRIYCELIIICFALISHFTCVLCNVFVTNFLCNMFGTNSCVICLALIHMLYVWH